MKSTKSSPEDDHEESSYDSAMWLYARWRSSYRDNEIGLAHLRSKYGVSLPEDYLELTDRKLVGWEGEFYMEDGDTGAAWSRLLPLGPTQSGIDDSPDCEVLIDSKPERFFDVHKRLSYFPFGAGYAAGDARFWRGYLAFALMRDYEVVFLSEDGDKEISLAATVPAALCRSTFRHYG